MRLDYEILLKSPPLHLLAGSTPGHAAAMSKSSGWRLRTFPTWQVTYGPLHFSLVNNFILLKTDEDNPAMIKCQYEENYDIYIF